MHRNARNWWIKNKTEVTQPSQQPQSPLNRDLSQNGMHPPASIGYSEAEREKRAIRQGHGTALK